ncbi:MAG TPA: pyridoxamine 5'-phosphate oxidase family protein [Atribacterota bacterium]|nr:pyridoxamine 5'-phosphate oxidase family protein [Atribacterota bacterium]
MRRKDKEITNIKEINEIIMEADFCNVAMSKNNAPYLVPMNYGFHEPYIYLHSANEGLKIDILRRNPQVCIGIVGHVKLEKSSDVCKTGMKYNSVIIFGKAEFLTNKDEKSKALTHIVQHYEQDVLRDKLIFDESELNRVTVLKVRIEKITGKK